MIKSILIWIVVVAGALIAVAAGAFVVVLLAAGVGALLTRLFPFSMFEATLLSLIAALGVVIVIGRVVASALRTPSPASEEDDEEELIDEWEEDEWEEDDWEDDDEFPDEPDLFPPVTRWQQPIRRAEFEGVGRNEPCPCGSGKKYKYCHGRPEHAT